MGDGDEFDVERPDVDALPRADDLDRNLRRAGLAEPPRLEQAGRETRRDRPGAEARPKIGERADMVLMRVGDDDADEVLRDLLDEADVGHDQDRRPAVPSPAKATPRSTISHLRALAAAR